MKKLIVLIPLMLLAMLPATPANAGWLSFAGYDKAGSFDTVAGDFTVPRFNCSNPNDDGFIAVWVGISASQLHQTGISAWCSGGNRAFSIWYENYPNPPHNYCSGCPIAGGDRFHAEVDINGAQPVKFTIRNETQGGQDTIVTNVAGQAGDREWLAEAQVVDGGQADIPPFLEFEFRKDNGFPSGMGSIVEDPFLLGQIQGCGSPCQKFWIRDNR